MSFWLAQVRRVWIAVFVGSEATHLFPREGCDRHERDFFGDIPINETMGKWLIQHRKYIERV